MDQVISLRVTLLDSYEKLLAKHEGKLEDHLTIAKENFISKITPLNAENILCKIIRSETEFNNYAAIHKLMRSTLIAIIYDIITENQESKYMTHSGYKDLQENYKLL